MSKRKLQFSKGSYYHLTNRTSSGVLLFKDMEDYILFDERVMAYAEEANFEIITKCLMPTHYHLLVRQDGDFTPSKYVQKLSISYSNSYRNRYGHHGSLFENRFSATEIVNMHQMRNTCLYIQFNAFVAGLVSNPIDWLAGDLALFLSEKFWDKQNDPYLLESFGSFEGFREAFEIYMETVTVKKSSSL